MYADAAHAPASTDMAGTQPVPLPAAIPAASASMPPPMMFCVRTAQSDMIVPGRAASISAGVAGT